MVPHRHLWLCKPSRGRQDLSSLTRYMQREMGGRKRLRLMVLSLRTLVSGRCDPVLWNRGTTGFSIVAPRKPGDSRRRPFTLRVRRAMATVTCTRRTNLSMRSTCRRRLRTTHGRCVAATFFISCEALALAFLSLSCSGMTLCLFVAAFALAFVAFSAGNVQHPVTSLPRFGDWPGHLTENLIQR